ncbi:MAG TPA: sigma-54 dependent transcriptional regulator [Candidatus Sulfotelmatobacter sp.]|jgi:DNA-binding NtrC family response regulator|nr:sigma-54 dependent transcriptional regulator [Candidatus Sulfotelmatobacter sp.]
MKGKILIVDDEPELRMLLKSILETDYTVTDADCGATLQKKFADEAPDVVLLDLKLPDANGLDLLPQIKKNWPDTEVIVLTGEATFEAAVSATKRGAYHFINKPFDTQALQVTIDRAIENRQQKEENNSLRRALSTMSGGSAPVFQSAALQAVVRTIERVAPSDVPILITGESGTGKEVISDLIHSMSPRAKAKIVKVNCAALPRELIESELFGSVKGAFTGATTDREGLFRQAEGGTLFLDEIGEMPIDTQSKLLRVLQDQKVRPVGGKTDYQTNCRLLAATNRKPEDAIKDGKLREDLFYRISAISVHIPPLRERRDDIMPLANAFLKKFAAQANRVLTGFTPQAVERLTSFDWPGNVRQLQNEIQRAVLLSEGPAVNVTDLSISDVKFIPTEGHDTAFTLLEGVERNAIIQMLKETGGNKLETAKRLGIGRQTLYNKIKAYGIEM